MSATDNVTIANEIVRQLGGNRFCAMTGAKNFIATERGVTFRIGRNASGVNVVKIDLRADDTYDVYFRRLWGHKMTEKGFASGIYCDMLRPVFESQTGMATSL